MRMNLNENRYDHPYVAMSLQSFQPILLSSKLEIKIIAYGVFHIMFVARF